MRMSRVRYVSLMLLAYMLFVGGRVIVIYGESGLNKVNVRYCQLLEVCDKRYARV